MSLAAVLDDVFEEVLNTPPTRKNKRRRLPTAQLTQPPDQPLQPIDLTVSPAKGQAGSNPAHPPMSPIDLTGPGTEAVPAPAAAGQAARKRVRKWDQMPEPPQNGAAAQPEAVPAPCKPISSAAVPVDKLEAAQELAAQRFICPEPHKSKAQQQRAPALQAPQPSRPVQAKENASRALEAAKLPLQASAPDQAAHVQEEASVGADAASAAVKPPAPVSQALEHSHPLHAKQSASTASEVLAMPAQASAPDRSAQVQEKASTDPHPASAAVKPPAAAPQTTEQSKPWHAKESASSASEALAMPAQASAPDHASSSQEQEKASMDPDPDHASSIVKPLVPGCALICACSAQEADESFNRHQLPLPQKLRGAHPKAFIWQGLRVFLHNADTQRLLGPFYAKQAKGSDEKVSL